MGWKRAALRTGGCPFSEDEISYPLAAVAQEAQHACIDEIRQEEYCRGTSGAIRSAECQVSEVKLDGDALPVRIGVGRDSRSPSFQRIGPSVNRAAARPRSCDLNITPPARCGQARQSSG